MGAAATTLERGTDRNSPASSKTRRCGIRRVVWWASHNPGSCILRIGSADCVHAPQTLHHTHEETAGSLGPPESRVCQGPRPTRGLAPLSDFVGDKGLSPLIPYVTGVEVWEDLVLLSAYSASEDYSSLWLFDRSGAEIAFLEVPFKIRVRGHIGEIVAMERWIGPPELSGYSLEFGPKPRN